MGGPNHVTHVSLSCLSVSGVSGYLAACLSDLTCLLLVCSAFAAASAKSYRHVSNNVGPMLGVRCSLPLSTAADSASCIIIEAFRLAFRYLQDVTSHGLCAESIQQQGRVRAQGRSIYGDLAPAGQDI
ncbi:hypothetical protein B0I35DRAFT_37954 [Stachybotrys elegans]|uniref:Uncharacterized protein n=1 Tax=Stachybotrys elegans TaxID=80388 RepID=A0A8K0T5G2_9HYPO|nr:hypothetical protein B0I35DRAFT_37954 [Stachybotrys elegans]